MVYLDNSKLYKFESLKRFLTHNGYKVESAGTYKTILHELTLVEQSHNIRFTDDGVVYTDKEGREWLGYIYKKYYNFSYGSEPKFHLCDCKTIEGWGRDAYMFTNIEKVKCYDSGNENKERPVENLAMCKNCIKERIKNGLPVWRTSKSFVRHIKENRTDEAIEIDKWGYAKEWREHRNTYMEKKRYTCERCGIKLSGLFDSSFLEIHHKNKEKSDDRESNLECLCVKCHSEVDSAHKQEYAHGAKKVLLDMFLKNHR